MLCWCTFGRTRWSRSLIASVFLHAAALGAGFGVTFWYVAPEFHLGSGKPGAPKGGLGFQYVTGPEKASVSPLVSVSPHEAIVANEVFVDKLANEVPVESLKPALQIEAEALAA